MFLSLFYTLRDKGIPVTLSQWMTVLEGLKKGLHGSSLSGFYFLCRAIVVTSEAEFDRFDQAFLTFFGYHSEEEDLPEELLQWLEKPQLTREDLSRLAEITGLTEGEIEALFAKRLQEQKEEHNGGHKWIGTKGFTAFGNRGQKLEGIRVGGESLHKSAYRIASQRRYRDWRDDCTLDMRQFQVALQSLRQLSKGVDRTQSAFDLEGTIQKTSANGGVLSIQYTYPRKNTIKLILLMDSGGSMEPYQTLCSMLFQSVRKTGGYQDLQIYYFHNYPGKLLYRSPTLALKGAVETEWLLRNTSSDYRIIIVGDGEMSMRELVGGWGRSPGMDWLLRLKDKYDHIIWLHPQQAPVGHSYWTQSFRLIESQFSMYQLTLDGLTRGVKQLLVNR